MNRSWRKKSLWAKAAPFCTDTLEAVKYKMSRKLHYRQTKFLFQLLSGQPPDGEESGASDVIEGATPADQIVSLYKQFVYLIRFLETLIPFCSSPLH